MPIADKNLYENFVKRQPDGTFFQSWAFGEFQEQLPYRGKAWALMMREIEAGCLIIKIALPFGQCWLWVPYGPLGFSGEVFEDLARIGREENAVFARIEPPKNWNKNHTIELKKHWRMAVSKNRFTPEHTLILDLENKEDKILAQMKPKGRYNIVVAKKHGVQCRGFKSFRDVPPQDFSDFYVILQKTSVRDEFGIHPKEFYEKLLRALEKDGMAELMLAYKTAPDKKVIAGIIVIYYGNTATYYYGASDYEHRNLMAPYLLQWEAVCKAKAAGMKHYDFLGIAPAGVKNHPWAGVTEFKKKFGGREESFPPAFDIVYKPAHYKLLSVIKRIRR